MAIKITTKSYLNLIEKKSENILLEMFKESSL